MAESMIEGVREYIAGCPLLGLSDVKKLHINWTDSKADSHGIIPDGDITIKRFINGVGKHRYSFSLFVRRFSAADYDDLRNAEFIEKLQRWCNEQSLAKVLPELPDGLIPSRIEAVNGMAFEPDKSGKTGLFSMQFNLFYIDHRR